jgi:nucleotide-binding universal stress UspA family protein
MTMNTKDAPRDVVVGFDGSRHAAEAVEWAAAEAVRQGSRLQVLSSGYVPGMPSWAGVAGAPLPRSIELAAEELADEARRIAAKILPEDAIETRAVTFAAAPALIDASSQAALVVVGHRGRRALASAVLGSVSSAVAQWAHCPVVVVRGSVEAAASPGPVTVGVDGTPESEAALLFAAEHAARDGAPLLIVCAWLTLTQTGWEFANWQPDAVEEWAQALATSARRAVDDAVGTVRTRWPDLTVQTRVVEASPALALEEASRESRLLVVGSHGTGALARLVLGSVSHSVLHHAACPVAVLPPQGSTPHLSPMVAPRERDRAPRLGDSAPR